MTRQHEDVSYPFPLPSPTIPPHVTTSFQNCQREQTSEWPRGGNGHTANDRVPHGVSESASEGVVVGQILLLDVLVLLGSSDGRVVRIDELRGLVRGNALHGQSHQCTVDAREQHLHSTVLGQLMNCKWDGLEE